MYVKNRKMAKREELVGKNKIDKLLLKLVDLWGG